jgi:hypothetical protein
MRVVIKPAGAIILTLAIAALSVFAFQGWRRANAPTYSALPPPGEDRLAATRWGSMANPKEIAEFQERQETVVGGDGTVPVYKVRVKKVPKNPWDVQWLGRAQTELREGEPLRLVFQARSPDKCSVNVACQESKAPYGRTGGGMISLTGKWTTYTIPFRAVRDYKSDEFQVALQCGIKTGTIEIADVHLMPNRL